MLSAPRNPIVLVHGWLDRKSIFKSMIRFLEAEGWTVYAPNLIPNDGRAPLPELARQLKEFIEDTLPANTPFDLLGFSMGGLVTRYYLQRMGGNERVERYINVSAPNNGTLSAYSLPFAGIKQIRPQSDFLADLNSDLESALEKIRVTWVWTPYDLMIFPADSTCLPIGREVKIPVLVHAWMLGDRRVIEAVAEALQET